VSVTVVRPVGLRGVGFRELEDDPDYWRRPDVCVLVCSV